jgi:hypothetical protein
MKAVLEFTYPEDEDKLRYAMHGVTAVAALDEMRQMIRSWEKHDGTNPEAMVERLKQRIFDALTACGEE